MKPKVSIVVPIYNVEKYLSQCVDSLLCQTLTDIEIILVDDGSPDRCGEIADRYAASDSRVKVIHQENAGLGPARNTGMKAATGDYIGFVDSDDWVRPEMYQRLYDTAIRAHADITVGGHCLMNDGTVFRKEIHPLCGLVYSDRESILNIRKKLFGIGLGEKTKDPFPMSVCFSIYRKTMIRQNECSFRNVLSEDKIFNLDAYQWANCISFTDYADYCYRKEGQASITQSFSSRKQMKYQEFLTLLADMAGREDAECVMRAKRTAIDYCRAYLQIIGASGLSGREKRSYLRQFAEALEIKKCWEGYPLDCLPVQQRIVHLSIVHRHYGTALLMNWIRRNLLNSR